MSERKNKKNHPLVNMFFVTLKDNKPNTEGCVVRKIDKDHFMIRYFSFMDGHLMEGEEIATFEEMKKWLFFETSGELREMRYRSENWDEGSIQATEYMAKRYEGNLYNGRLKKR